MQERFQSANIRGLGRRQIEPYIPYLTKRAQDGCASAGVLYRELQEKGYSGGYKGVNSWLREYFGKPGRKSSSPRKIAEAALFGSAPGKNRENSTTEYRSFRLYAGRSGEISRA